MKGWNQASQAAYRKFMDGVDQKDKKGWKIKTEELLAKLAITDVMIETLSPAKAANTCLHQLTRLVSCTFFPSSFCALADVV